VTDLEFRPLSLGELLDRSISLYRGNFRLFAGISAVPHVFVLALSLVQVAFVSAPLARARAAGAPTSPGSVAATAFGLISFLAEAFVVYLLAQGATAGAVSELYLGRSTSVWVAFRSLLPQVWRLARVVLLNGLFISLGGLLFFVPGISLACRLMVGLPAAALERLRPWESIRRSFRLTRGNAGRAFLIYVLYVVLRFAAYLLVFYGYRLTIELSSRGLVVAWMILAAAANVATATIVGPFVFIAATVFYFDLRIRKEALDIQLMMGDRSVLPPAPDVKS